MACNCIDGVNEKLRTDHQTELGLALFLDGRPARVNVATYVPSEFDRPSERRPGKKRPRPVSLVASFCPFCGCPYDPACDA